MTAIQVAFPVLRGRRRFHVEKGQRWSVVEHLMLDAVARTPASAAELAENSRLPRRVVVEAFIRLMRAGWVEIAAGPEGPIFDVTPTGRAHAQKDVLPAATVRQPRWMGFVIDQAAGNVFRAREIILRHRNDLAQAPGTDALVYLEKSEMHSQEDLAELFAAMEGEDEIIVGVDPSPEKLVERFGVVTITDGVVEGLPARANQELREIVVAKAGEASSKMKVVSVTGAPPPPIAEPISKIRRVLAPALFEQGDLIIDGPAHEAALKSALHQAREEVIIHSTFISENAVATAFPLFVNAVSRGARVHILWGQDEEKETVSSSRKAVGSLQAAIKESGWTDNIIVHPFTTQSHAKLLIADDGAGHWSAIVGSCNWLSSIFDSFETSIKLRDPELIGECIRHVAAMSLGPPGVWHEWASDLTVLGRRIAALPRGNGRTVPMQLLLTPDHGALVLKARDEAERRIFVLSHRIGLAGRPMVIIPALAAAKAHQVTSEFYYGRPTGVLSGVDAAGLAIELAREGVTIQPIYQPKLHAKVLAWDDDALAITSQNWLSADPAAGALRREIGVFIKSSKVADYLIRRFEHAKTHA